MTISDKLYTQINIDNPIIEALINTKPFQRLKAINQYGGVDMVFPNKYQVNRFQHSIGVYHVLKALGANIETQVAGLLHDVGHTAFSHMYDMALQTHTEDNHEKIMHKLDGWNEIQDILEKNSLKIGNPDQYILIKRTLPDIGADRFDYALRDFIFATNSTTDFAQTALSNISTDSEGIYFKTQSIARQFAEMGNKAMWHVIYEPNVAVVYQSLIETIRIGFRDKWLNENDFLQTDKYVFDKILQHRNHFPEIYSKVFTHKYTVEETSQDVCDFTFIKLKSRYFDPQVQTKEGNVRLSEIDQPFKENLSEYIKFFEKAKTGIYYRVKFS